MADRTVSARLRADVTGYIAAMRAATTATRQLADESERVGRRTSSSFDDARRSSERASRAFRESGESARRSGQQTERAALASRRAQLAAAEATERAERAQQAAAEAAQRLARGEIDQAEATRLATQAARAAERADIARTEAAHRQAAATDTQTEATRALGTESKRAGGLLVSLAAGGVAAGAAVSGAAAAVGAFGVIAVPTIAKVVTAQEDLAANWTSLSKRQQVTALTVDRLTDEYKDLARSYEPETLAAFHSVLATGSVLMPKLGGLMDGTADSVNRFIDRLGGFVSGPEMTGFLGFAERSAPQALDQVGDALLTTGSLSLRLFEDLAPLGMSLLTVTNGALGLVNGLAQVNPAIAQLAVTGLLLRGPINGIVAGVGNMTTRMRAAATATRGASLAGRALNLAAAAGPNLYLAAGVALAFLAVKALNTRSSLDKLVEGLRIEHRATGNNLAGYQALRQELQGRYDKALQVIDAHQRLSATSAGMASQAYGKSAIAARDASAAKGKLGHELEKLNGQIRNVTRGSELLSGKYGISADQARSLATAAGVDLTTAMDKNGKLTNQAAAKIDQYRMSVEAAKDPTRLVKLALDDASNSALSMKDRMTALATALDAYFNPSIAAYKATTQLKQGYQELISSLSAAKGRMDGNTAASARLRLAFASQLESVSALWQATIRKTGSEERGRVAVERQLPILYALAGRNREARAQVDALARSTGNATGAMGTSRGAFMRAASSMGIARDRANELWRAFNKLKPKRVPVDVYAQGHWTASGEHRRFPGMGLAEGGPVPALAPGATRAYDSQPAMLRVDEHVWTPEEVDAVGGHGAMYRMRRAARAGELRGYASGGRVSMSAGGRSSSAVVADVMAPIQAGYADMIGSIAQVFADAWKKFAAAGGGVVAAARKWIGTPYSWGGGGIGGPSLGIGRGAGTVGFDCSGLTEKAYWDARHIRIGGTTYEQHPRSVPSERRPGALGFNASLGHVVIASNRPGMVIEAPFTGGFVREVPKSMPDWRIPKGASFAAGGEVKALAMDSIGGRPSAVDAQLARILQLAGSGPRGPERHDAQIARAGAMRLWAEPETGGEAYIPLAPSKRARSLSILGQVARRFGVGLRMADGGIVSFADGGIDSADLNLSDILSRWQQTVNPATKGDVTAAARARRTQLDQLRNAEAALRKARKSKDADRIAAAERKVRKEREDLAAATDKLRDVENRYNLGRKPAAAQLGAALGMSIKNTGAFIKNIGILADRGFGTLARHLLDMGGPEAEKIAASAVKMSDKSLRGLTRQIGTAQQQQDTLAAMPTILTAKGALKSGQVKTWMDLQRVTGVPPKDLAAALRLMQADLFKTPFGKQIFAQMVAMGYASGGWIGGPAGTDRVPIMATAGEFMVNATSAARYRPVIEAINADRTGARLRQFVPGPRAGAALRGGGGVTVNQTFYVTVEDRADVTMMMNAAEFQARAATL